MNYIEKEIERLQKENDALQAEMLRRIRFIKEILVVGGRIKGKRFVGRKVN